jgi:outer membrane cobalamin receptor
MKTSKLAVSLAVAGLVGTHFAAADPRAEASGNNEVPQRDKEASSYHAPLGPAVAGTEEKLVFVTGSRIPKRLRVKAIGTETTSPVRVYTRAEIDRTGQFTTQGILAQDPSLRVINGGAIGSH